jgi:hypothetical protein
VYKACLSLILLLLSSNSCYAGGGLQLNDPLFISTETSILLDYSTTLNFIRHPTTSINEEDGSLTSRIIGRHPSATKVRLYFASLAISYAYLRYKLPNSQSDLALSFGILTHGRASLSNIQLGAKLSF